LAEPEEEDEPRSARRRVILGDDLRNPTQYSVWRTSESGR